MQELAFEAGRVAAGRGWDESIVVDLSDVERLGPDGPPVVVIGAHDDLTVNRARSLAAVAGAGRQLMVVTDAPSSTEASPWLPKGLVHVIGEPIQARQVESSERLPETVEPASSPAVDETPDPGDWTSLPLETGSYLDQMDPALNGPAMEAWQRFLEVRNVTVMDQGRGTGLSAGQWRLNGAVPAVVWFQPLRSRADHREYLVLRSTIAVVADTNAPILTGGSWWQKGFVEHILSWCEQPEAAAMIGRVMGFGTGLTVIGRSGPGQSFPSAGANDIRRVLATGDGRCMPLVFNSNLVEVDCGNGARSLDFAYCVAESADFESFQDSLEQAIDSLVRVQVLLTDPYSTLEGRRETRLGDELMRFMDSSRMTAQGTLATARATT